MDRAVCGLIVVAWLGCFGGCQAPDANRVPWYRGLPALVAAPNSLEAEMWRRQHGRPGGGPGLPREPVVGPLGPADAPVNAPAPDDEGETILPPVIDAAAARP